MTTVQYILIIIAVVIMVVGLYMIVRAILNRKNSTAAQADIQYKNGIPIVPRHKRQIADENVDEAAEDEWAEDIVESPDQHAAAEYSEMDMPDSDAAEQDRQSTTHIDIAPHYTNTVYDDLQQPASQGQAPQAQAHSHAAPAMNADIDGIHIDNDPEDDLFSSLASATESLMPVIETAPEPDFRENSPVLDSHLLAEADQDQNSPLNHAQENINITLVPKNHMEMIGGKTVLSLVSQYGLKYGAMNMFHRYEQKDGTGILWFSMMGITEKGDITPFDLNMLPTARFKGLVLFLSLPHPKAMQGFDSMMSVVNLIANDLNTLVLDENNDVLTRERRQQLRTQVQEYQASFKQR